MRYKKECGCCVPKGKHALRCPSNSEKDKKFYRTFLSMYGRCYCKSGKFYAIYGGKGIQVAWKTFADFKKDMYESYLEHYEKYGSKETTLDRIDSDDNYCKENCRWATWKVQTRNKKNVYQRVDRTVCAFPGCKLQAYKKGLMRTGEQKYCLWCGFHKWGKGKAARLLCTLIKQK